MKAGDTIKACGYEWEIMNTDYNGGILCLTKEPICTKAFDDDNINNFYPESTICKYLAKLTKKLESQGAKFKTVSLDMRADDGTGWDKGSFSVTGLFLLTERMYQDYKQYISDKSKCWWLATAYSFVSGYSYLARLVSTDGSLYSNGTFRWYYGVVPACVFSIIPENDKYSQRLGEMQEVTDNFLQEPCAEESKEQTLNGHEMINEVSERELQNTSINNVSLADYFKENYIAKEYGEWIERKDLPKSVDISTANLRWKYECSKCGYEARSKYHFCPNCCRCMIKPQKNEDKE